MVICFTGHRPNKLGGYDFNSEKNRAIMTKLFLTINDLIYNNPNESFHFICGGALGLDQMAFFVCECIKNSRDVPISIELAIPFKDQANSWKSKQDIYRYRKQIANADIVTYVDRLPNYNRDKRVNEGGYSAYKLQVRNEYMVDQSNIVIAYWNGDKSGGTYNCIKYAEKNNKTIINVKR